MKPTIERYHEGRPIVRSSSDRKGIIILCPAGHVYTYVENKHWAGSSLAALATNPKWTVKCCGALPS